MVGPSEREGATDSDPDSTFLFIVSAFSDLVTSSSGLQPWLFLGDPNSREVRSASFVLEDVLCGARILLAFAGFVLLRALVLSLCVGGTILNPRIIFGCTLEWIFSVRRIFSTCHSLNSALPSLIPFLNTVTAHSPWINALSYLLLSVAGLYPDRTAGPTQLSSCLQTHVYLVCTGSYTAVCPIV